MPSESECIRQTAQSLPSSLPGKRETAISAFPRLHMRTTPSSPPQTTKARETFTLCRVPRGGLIYGREIPAAADRTHEGGRIAKKRERGRERPPKAGAEREREKSRTVSSRGESNASLSLLPSERERTTTDAITINAFLQKCVAGSRSMSHKSYSLSWCGDVTLVPSAAAAAQVHGNLDERIWRGEIKRTPPVLCTATPACFQKLNISRINDLPDKSIDDSVSLIAFAHA